MRRYFKAIKTTCLFSFLVVMASVTALAGDAPSERVNRIEQALPDCTGAILHVLVWVFIGYKIHKLVQKQNKEKEAKALEVNDLKTINK